MLRAAVFLLAALFGVYVLVCAAVAFWQRKLIYFPEAPVHATPRAVGLAHEEVRLETSDELTLTAWWVPREAARGAALVLHGNGGNRASSLAIVAELHRLGFDVLLPDYRGYGGNPGKPSEQGLRRDARAAWDHLVRARGVEPERVLLHGHSLGGAVAVALASEADVDPGAVVVENVFTSVPDLGAEVYPWLPVRLLARDRWDSLARVEKLSAPLFVAYASGDRMIDPDHSRRIAERAGGRAHSFAGDHDSSILFDGAEELDAFLARCFGSRESAAATAGGATR